MNFVQIIKYLKKKSTATEKLKITKFAEIVNSYSFSVHFFFCLATTHMGFTS